MNNFFSPEFVKVLMLTPLQCKAQFLSVLSNWPLFGSSFFAVKRVFGDDIGMPEDDSGTMWRELILALNHRGVLFLDSNTHETLHHWHFIEIISTRKVRKSMKNHLKISNYIFHPGEIRRCAFPRHESWKSSPTKRHSSSDRAGP